MLIDPVVVFAQIVNFVILVALLKRFLYRPILIAIKRREQYINAQLEEAKSQQAIAQHEAERSRQQQADFEQQRATLEEQVRLEIETYRQTLLEEANQACEQAQKKWLKAVKRERTSFLVLLKQDVATQILTTVRHILADLAQVSLEQTILEAFILLLDDLPLQDKTVLNRALCAFGTPSLLIESSFPISESDKIRLKQAVLQYIPGDSALDISIRFAQRSSLIAGIELSLPGYKLAWTFEYYLEVFNEHLAQILEYQDFDVTPAMIEIP